MVRRLDGLEHSPGKKQPDKRGTSTQLTRHPKETSSQWLFKERQVIHILDTIMFFLQPKQHFQGKYALSITPEPVLAL